MERLNGYESQPHNGHGMAAQNAGAEATLDAQLRQANAALEEALAHQIALVHELDHRVKNNLQLMIALVALEYRSQTNPEVRHTLKHLRARLQALGTVHRNRYILGEVNHFDGAAFACRLVEEMLGKDAYVGLDTRIARVPVQIASNKASALALLLHEIMGRKLRLAAASDTRRIDMRIGQEDGDFVFTILRPRSSGDSAHDLEYDNALVTMLKTQMEARITPVHAGEMSGVALRMPTGLATAPGRGFDFDDASGHA